MPGRTVVGEAHEPWCEFPWHECTCDKDKYVPPKELMREIDQTLDKLKELMQKIKDHRDGKQPT